MAEPFALSLPGAGLPAADLPRAEGERFQPLRAGILNLWQYDDQVFRFHQGRLLLRGENGSGKSKALELLLPFLLDADLSPQRLDPFGGTSRTMEWNLLQGDRYESRIGYVWLELGRTGDEGHETWTLGCGLRASQRTRRVDSWYFLTRRRVGGDLDLLLPDRTPLLKDELRQRIGDRGWVFDTGREYREKLDAQIYGLGEHRFATLRHLLLQLRRPHLSERLEPHTLSDLLKESLPPLDPDLIGQLSEGFERLDNDQRELARVEEAARSASAFLDLYREYARGMARGRAAEVRQSDSRHRKTAAEVREAEEDRERLGARLEELSARERQAGLEIEAARGRLRALEQSEAMRSAEALRAQGAHAETLAARARQDDGDAKREDRLAAERRSDADSAEGEARQAAGERQEAARAAGAAARDAGLEAAASAAFEALPEHPKAAEATARAAVKKQEEGIAELRRLASERDDARRREERAGERLRDADAQVRAARERSLAARGEVEGERERLAEALLAWRRGLSELRLDESAFEALESRAEEVAHGREDDLAPALVAAVRLLEHALVRERAALGAEADAAQQERRATAEERERVAAARELGPEPPRTRASDRTGRPGAPLYLLCDFPRELPEAERAGLEAALEAAGLLDAWVLPDGALLAPGTLDTSLAPAPPAASARRAGKTLANLLQPSPGHGVERETIEAVLASLEILSGDGGEPGRHGVGPAGAFRLGPLAGAWAKPVAEHVGAGAREAARQRRLAELSAALEALDLRLAELASRSQALDGRLDRLRREAAALPSPAALVRAVLQAEAAAEDERRRRAELAEAEAAAAQARAGRESAERRLGARARELGLAAHLDDLDGQERRLRRFEAAFLQLLRSAAEAARAGERAGRARRAFEAAAARAGELDRRARESAAAAEAARAEHAELEATLGAEAREVVERHRAEALRLQDLEERRRDLTEEGQQAREQRARAEERLALRQGDLQERDAERARAVERLRTAVEAGFLPLVLPALLEAAPAEPSEEAAPEPAPAWSLTRALDLAREIEKASADVDLGPEAANRRANRLHDRFRTLAADLGADFQPSLEQVDDLSLVRVGYNGREHDVPSLVAALREGIEVRRALLADHERALLRRFLLGEVGNHLRNRLREARALVEQMNQLLVECRTASGMSLKLAWAPLPEAAPEIQDAVNLLRRDLELLGDAERRRLEAFFQGRIAQAREEWEAVPWRDHLMAALDYRSWFRFRILRRTGEGDGWAELTRRGHGAASGGEKAVALHLPLFAAAAAHYRSARDTAPRIVLLDEAFAGIDQGMRGRCMGLLVALDLDFLMTSHDEWGCYEELPGVATYQLFRDAALDGVAAVRFVWDGRRLKEESL